MNFEEARKIILEAYIKEQSLSGVTLDDYRQLKEAAQLIERLTRDTFYDAIVNSKEWDLWVDEQNKRMKKVCENEIEGKNHKRIGKIFDISECTECNLISPEHFSEFIKFIKKL